MLLAKRDKEICFSWGRKVKRGGEGGRWKNSLATFAKLPAGREPHLHTHSGGGFPSKFYHFSKNKMWERFFFGLAWRVPCRLDGVVKQKRTSFGQADLQWFFLCASYQYERQFLLRLPLISGGFFNPSSRTQEPYQVVKFRINAREAFAWRAFSDGVSSVCNCQAK